MLFGLSLQSANARAEAANKLISCHFALNQSLSILRDHRIADTYVYYLQKQDIRERLFNGNENESRGEAVIARCLGNKDRILLVSGEFSSNYIKGLVLRYNQKSMQWERIDFAERARPSRVYLSDKQMMVVIPNHRLETDKKYLIYTYVSEKGRSKETVATDSLPSIKGQHIIRINK